MADGNDSPKKLDKDQALRLAHQGKDAWNAWAKEHPGWIVGFSGYDFTNDPISFAGFIFPGSVSFVRCTFSNADFYRAQFGGDLVHFSEVTFNGGADFSDVRFSGVAIFSGTNFNEGVANFFAAQFGGMTNFSAVQFCKEGADFQNSVFVREARFTKARFEGAADFRIANFQSAVYLDGACCKQVPDFRYTKQERHFTLHGVEVDYAVHKNDRGFLLGVACKRAADISDADKFRRLKELAMQAKDHDREQAFFANELKAKRFYETKDFGGLAWSYLYEWFSDFGRSVSLPALWLVLTWFVFGAGYWLASPVKALGALMVLGNGLKLSASVLVPFVAAARTSYREAKEALYGPDTGLLLDMFVIFEGILGLAFVFLIGLALRNRFRI